MATWTAIITDAGTALQTNQVKGSTITLTRAVSGAAVTTPSNLASLTEMSSVKQTLSLGTLKMDRVNSQFTVQINLSNENVTTKYDLRQIGIYAKDSQTNKEILFAIAQIDVAKPINTPENAPGYNIEWQFTFNNPNDNKMAVIINNESLQEQMTFLQNNVSPSGEVEGSIIEINNSANLPLVNLNIYGKSEQGFTTGSQLIPQPYSDSVLNASGITFTPNEDGSVSVKGTATANAYFTMAGDFLAAQVSIPEWLVEGDTYTISGGTSEIGILPFFYSEDGETVSYGAYGNKNTFIMPSGFDYYGIFIQVPSGRTVNTTVYPMLNTGDIALPYEIYTGGIPGPNPEYPLDINSVGDSGSIEVGVYGKNLVNVADVEINNFTGHHSPIPLDFEIIVGQTYTLSMDIESTVQPFITSVGLGSKSAYYLDAGYGNNQNNGRAVITFTPTKKQAANGSYLHIRAPRYSESTTFSAKVSNIQLELGTVATEYEPGKGQKLTLSIENGLPGLPVDNGGNYVDADGQHWVCDEVDLERGVYIQRIVCTEFNGSENWLKSTDNNNNYMYHTSLSANTVGSSDSMCNRLIDAGGTSPLQVEGQTTDLLGYFVSKKYNVLYVNMGYYMTANTVDELKTILSSKSITVHYPLLNPIETALTTEEMQVYRAITTYEPNTTIMNNIGADMKAQYVPQLYGPLMGMIFNRLNNMIGDVNAALDEINGEVV